MYACVCVCTNTEVKKVTQFSSKYLFYTLRPAGKMQTRDISDAILVCKSSRLVNLK